MQPPFPASTCNNQEFRIRCCLQIQLPTSNSWSFLPIPELHIFLEWLSDHYQSCDKCKAEFLHFCTLGIAGNCRNSRWFRVSPAVFISAYSTYIHPVRDIELGNEVRVKMWRGVPAYGRRRKKTEICSKTPYCRKLIVHSDTVELVPTVLLLFTCVLRRMVTMVIFSPIFSAPALRCFPS